MKSLNEVTSIATARINNARDFVTGHIRKVLIKAGIPQEVAVQYSANYCSGGEWILDNDEGSLAQCDIQLVDNELLVEQVKELEDLDTIDDQL